MKTRLVGAAALGALICLGYSPVAMADCFRPTTVTSAVTPIPARDTWDTSDFTGTFTATLTDGKIGGTWDFGSVNPYLRDLARDGADVRTGFQAIGVEEALRFLTRPNAPSNSAVLNFSVGQTGDRDGDTIGDYRLTLRSAAFTGGGLAQVGSAGQPLPTPEPASLILLGSGLAGLGFFGIRRRKTARR